MAPDPNAKLIQQIKHLENMISDLKKDVRFQRREIRALRAEQKILFDKEKKPEYNDEVDALEKLSGLELDEQNYITNKDPEELRIIIEKLCLDAIQKQKDRETKLGYGLDDYTEGRIKRRWTHYAIGAAVLARKILSTIRQVN